MRKELTPEELGTIRKLKQEGFAVVLFTPEELRDADPDTVENRLIEEGWLVIDSLAQREAVSTLRNAILVDRDGDSIHVYPAYDYDNNTVESAIFWRDDYDSDRLWVAAAEKHAERESKRTGLPVECNY